MKQLIKELANEIKDLYEFLTESASELKLDVIGICCDFSQYDTEEEE